MIALVLGGEKSGKSDLAYSLFCQASGPGVILAMGQARDAGFRRQILAHRLARDPALPLEEPGQALPEALERAAETGRNVLVDSLDFWVFACLADLDGRMARLEQALAAYAAPGSPQCVLVSCEVGLGPVAATSLVRRFARAQGELNRRVAAVAQRVTLVVTGLPVSLK